MEKRIHISKIWKLMEEKDRLGKPKPFTFKYAKLDGELKIYKNATFTSIHSKGATVNIMPACEKVPHTFRKILILRINEFKVYL